MKICVPINGNPTVGKDTFCEYVIRNAALWDILVESISSVDVIKTVATILGWDGIKDDKARKFLSDLKDLSTEYNDGPFLAMTQHVQKSNAIMIFVHVREPEEIDKIKQWCKLNTVYCSSLKLIRSSIKQLTNNTGDLGATLPYEYDSEIDNNGSLDDLEINATKWFDQVLASAHYESNLI